MAMARLLARRLEEEAEAHVATPTARFGGPAGLQGLITVNANQSALSGIDVPITGTCDGPVSASGINS